MQNIKGFPSSAEAHKEVNEISGGTGVAKVTPVFLWL